MVLHMAFRARLTAGFLLAVGCLIGSTPAAAAGTSWSSMAKVAGIFDIGGPRKDGWLVVAGARKLYLVDAKGGAVTPYAQRGGGHAGGKGAQGYLTAAPGLRGPGC